LVWAVEAFDWPGYNPAEVYAASRVVDEIDYLPVWYLHEVTRSAGSCAQAQGPTVFAADGYLYCSTPLFDRIV